MDSNENQIISDMYQDGLDTLDQFETVVVDCSGSNGVNFKKTFSKTYPREFDIVQKYMSSMLAELQSLWSKNEPYDERVINVKVDVDIDDALADDVISLSLDMIKHDRDALMSYMANKILNDKCL